MPVPIRSVKFWINAFIPRDIPSYTLPVPAGLHLGKTMIPGPNPASDCYLTDQRSFDRFIHAKSRMHSEFTISFTSATPMMSQWHKCDPTIELDCGDGDVELVKTGSTSRMKFTMLPPTKPPVVVITMECAASNPCAPSSRIFGDIDCKGRITVNAMTRSIEIDGLIDQFPAFEAYATINDGAGVSLFQILPSPGKTVMNLPGPPNRPVKFRLEDRNADGVFDTLARL
jgi:hypothetical protein